jgi:hypothetical protein
MKRESKFYAVVHHPEYEGPDTIVLFRSKQKAMKECPELDEYSVIGPFRIGRTVSLYWGEEN